MKVLEFTGLLQNNEWLSPAFVILDNDGRVTAISNENSTEIIPEKIAGYAIPGFQNAHSHAFQYAMAGLAEIHANPMADDDFWSWRDTMYKIALSVNPSHLEAIATMLYAEMLKHGYTSVAEFHYLHHNKNGSQYSNLSEMGERLIAAAQKTGIKITLVPIFYQKGGFGKKVEKNQRRFISSTTDDYARLLEASLASTKHYDGANLGIGIHSLRAVDAQSTIETITHHSANLPIHFHVSEQLQEIEDCLVHLKSRPVQWLLDNLDLNDSFHLVHATHINEYEMLGIAKSGANVVLCPSTEGNLGDGLFPLKDLQNAGGKWSIGTDSHIGLNPLEELRLLDYGQRLITHKRNQFISKTEGNTGRFAFDMSLMVGRKAMGNFEANYFAKGKDFDAVIIDENQPLISSCSLDKILPTLIYSADVSWMKGTMIKGKWVVNNLNHLHKEDIISNFNAAMKELSIRF